MRPICLSFDNGPEPGVTPLVPAALLGGLHDPPNGAMRHLDRVLGMLADRGVADYVSADVAP